MKLSISNIAWDMQEDDRVYAMMGRYDYAGLEIAPTRVFADAPYDHAGAVKKWRDGLAMQYGFAVPSMQSIWFGRKELLFGDDAQRQALLDYTKKAVDFAQALACGNLVFGCPKNRSLPDGGGKELWEEGVSFFRQLGSYAAERGTAIGMEANPAIYHTNYINTTRQAIELIEQVDSEGFLLNLDAGAMVENREGVELLEGKAGIINHVHISEPFLKPVRMDGERRRFHRELAAFLRENRYQGYVSVEMGRVDDFSLLDEILAYGKEMFG